MRVKPIPVPPDDLDAVDDARRAVPLVPATEEDCCARLVSRLDLQSRDVARTWLTLLRGLGFVESGVRGFSRTRDPPDDLAGAFLAGAFGAREVRSIIDGADEPLPADAVYERFEPHVPPWERRRDRSWRAAWRDRVAHLLDWLVLLGIAERTDGGYRPNQ